MSVASQSARPALRAPFIDADFDLSMLGATLWRHRAQIWRPTLAVALITFLVVTFIPPKYMSESRVLVVGRDNAFLRPDVDKDVAERINVDQEAVTSQAQLILSRDLALEVIKELKLGERAEFDPTRGGLSVLKTVLGFFGLAKNLMNMTQEERALDAYYDRLSVYPVEKSRVIVIDFLSETPEIAARVANAIADAYLERQQLAKQEQARSAGAWLSGEIETMRKKVADAEAKVEAFRAKSNLLVGPNGTTLSAQQLGELNAQLATARTLKADAEAKAKLIRQMLKTGEPIESSDILNSELIRRLSEQRVTLRAQLAEQSASLLDNHPRIKELKAQIEDLDKQIRKEAETVARSLENDARLADARVESQMAVLDQFKSQAATTNEQDVELRALERDAKSQRDLLESYLAKYREASARDTIASAPPDARVISRAMVSNVPAYPKKIPTLLIATFTTLVVCCGVIVTREFLAVPEKGGLAVSLRRIPPDAEALAAAAREAAPIKEAPPTSGSLAARLASLVKARPQPDEIPTGASSLDLAESAGPDDVPMSANRAGVPVSAIEEFAHSLHEEGLAASQIAFFAVSPQLDASRIAIKFARALVQNDRVVLVGLGSGDAALKEISSDPSAAGLAELTAGTASFGAIITKDRASALNLIFSGRAPAGRRALLSAPGMAQNFAALAKAYAHVVINAGVLRGGEVEAVARLASHAILLVGTLSSPTTRAAYERLLDAGFDGVTIFVAESPDAAAAATAAMPVAAA